MVTIATAMDKGLMDKEEGQMDTDEDEQREPRQRQQRRNCYCCCGSRCVDEEDGKEAKVRLSDCATQTEPVTDEATTTAVEPRQVALAKQRSTAVPANGRRRRCGRKGRRSSDLSINTELYGLKSLFGSGKVFAFGMNLHRSSSFESQRDEARLTMTDTTNGQIERSYDVDDKDCTDCNGATSVSEDEDDKAKGEEDKANQNEGASSDSISTGHGPIITLAAE